MVIASTYELPGLIPRYLAFARGARVVVMFLFIVTDTEYYKIDESDKQVK